jgi:hypothetical protein
MTAIDARRDGSEAGTVSPSALGGGTAADAAVGV